MAFPVPGFQKSCGETSCLLVLPLVASCQIKPDGSSFLFYFSTHFDHMFFVGVFLLFSRDHLAKRKQQKKNTLKYGSSSKGY